MTPLQTDLLRCLRSAVEAKPNRRVLHCSEWLGYLPFGLYHWMVADGQDISLLLPPDWSRGDLEALQKAGLLVKVEQWENPNDECETKVTYEVALAEAAASVNRPRD
jgi:hypothetical protein